MCNKEERERKMICDVSVGVLWDNHTQMKWPFDKTVLQKAFWGDDVKKMSQKGCAAKYKL